MKEGFYHENPSIVASKLFPPHWHYKPWDLTKSQSYYAAILEITNSVKFKHIYIYIYVIPSAVQIVWFLYYKKIKGI